jgi:hypothetical protein
MKLTTEQKDTLDALSIVFLFPISILLMVFGTMQLTRFLLHILN